MLFILFILKPLSDGIDSEYGPNVNRNILPEGYDIDSRSNLISETGFYFSLKFLPRESLFHKSSFPAFDNDEEWNLEDNLRHDLKVLRFVLLGLIRQELHFDPVTPQTFPDPGKLEIDVQQFHPL